MRRLWIGLALTACVVVSGAPAAEDGGSGDGKGRGGRRGQLTDEQIQQLKERFEQRQKERGGKTATRAGGGTRPKKAKSGAGRRAFKAGEAAFKAENYPGAFENNLVDVAAARISRGPPLRDQSRARILEMGEDGRRQARGGQAQEAPGRRAGALEVLKVLREKFYFTKVADEANNLLTTLATDPRVAAAVDMISAEDADTAGRYAEAAEKYEAIMKKYPDSVQALKAKLRLEAMKKDEAIAAAIKEGVGKTADAKCPGWLATGRNFVANGKPDQARPHFQKVIDNFPDSPTPRRPSRPWTSSPPPRRN